MMKHLKSTAQDLRNLTERALRVEFVCEQLVVFEDDAHVARVYEFMIEKDFDVVGVRCEGVVAGYCRRQDLIPDASSQLGQHLVRFSSHPHEGKAISDSASLQEAMSHLKVARFVFVTKEDHVFGIVTRGDLQKAPVRMWLFALLTLIEMQLLRLIRKHYPTENWKLLLSPKRVESAAKVLQDRKGNNEAIDLADCLQLCDKRDLFLKTEPLRQAVKFQSKADGMAFFRDMERQRNNLAHGQDISAGSWPAAISFIELAEQFLWNLEKL